MEPVCSMTAQTAASRVNTNKNIVSNLLKTEQINHFPVVLPLDSGSIIYEDEEDYDSVMQLLWVLCHYLNNCYHPCDRVTHHPICLPTREIKTVRKYTGREPRSC